MRKSGVAGRRPRGRKRNNRQVVVVGDWTLYGVAEATPHKTLVPASRACLRQAGAMRHGGVKVRVRLQRWQRRSHVKSNDKGTGRHVRTLHRSGLSARRPPLRRQHQDQRQSDVEPSHSKKCETKRVRRNCYFLFFGGDAFRRVETRLPLLIRPRVCKYKPSNGFRAGFEQTNPETRGRGFHPKAKRRQFLAGFELRYARV